MIWINVRSPSRTTILIVLYLTLLFLYGVVEVGRFLTLDYVSVWDTYFYFPIASYFTLASLFGEGQYPWWLPLSQGGLPVYYDVAALYHPLFPTAIMLWAMAGINEVLGLGISVYHLYVFQQLFLNQALIILLTLLICNRLYRSVITIAAVTSVVALSGYNILANHNSYFFEIAVFSLLFVYAFIWYFQARTYFSKIFLSLVMIYIALNGISRYSLHLLIYSIPLFLGAFLLFYFRAALRLAREYMTSLSWMQRVCLILAVGSGLLSSVLIVYLNVNVLQRASPTYTYDPMLWRDLPSSSIHYRPIGTQLKYMFFDLGGGGNLQEYLGAAILPFLITGVIAAKSRMRLVFLAVFLGLLFIMQVNNIYILITNAFQSLENNRHLGEMMEFGGFHFALFAAGYGIDFLLGQAHAADDDSRRKSGLALVILLIGCAILLLQGFETWSAANLLAWLAVAAVLGLTFLKDVRLKRVLIPAGVSLIMLLTALYFLDAVPDALVASEHTMPRSEVTLFSEHGWDLDFLESGDYISGNNILTDSQGYLFGDDPGSPQINLPHPGFNYMSPWGMGVMRAVPPDIAEQIIDPNLSRIRFPTTIYWVTNREEAFSMLFELTNVDNTAVLVDPNIEIPFGYIEDINTADTPSFTVDDFSFNQLSLTVTSDTERYLYYADGYDRFWYATVNGEDTPVYSANITHKAIRIPAGTSKVVFTYNPWLIKVAYSLTFVFTLLFLFYSWRATREGTQ